MIRRAKKLAKSFMSRKPTEREPATKKKTSIQRVQTAEGWRRMMLKKPQSKS